MAPPEKKPLLSTKKQVEPKDSATLIFESLGLAVLGLAAVAGVFYLIGKNFGYSPTVGLVSIAIGWAILKVKEYIFNKD